MKHQGLLEILLFLILILAVWLGALPAGQRFMALSRSQAALVEAETSATKLKTAVERNFGRYDVETGRLGQYLKALPDVLSQADLISQLQSIASRSGVVIDGLNIDLNRDGRRAAAGDSDTDLNTGIITLSLVGDYNQVKLFLRNVEANLPLISGQTLSLHASSDGVASLRYRLDLVLEVYGLK